MAEKEKAVVPEIIDNVEALEAKMKAMREAQKIFATFTQEQVDKIFYEAAMAANKQRIPLAKMAVEETQRGVMEDKVIKNHYAAEYIYNAYKNTKTCGVIEEDKAYGIKKVAEPIGLVAAVIPTTNPTSTAIFKTLICLKTRNAIIISPHPAAKKCTIAAAKVVLDAAVKAGAPEGIIGWIDIPSLELTNTVMRDSDIILATGGPGMVKAAYSSGKPALGVGAGNTPVIIDDTADVRMAVNSIIHSKTFDNGMICASEQSVTVLDSVYDAAKKEFEYRGCYFLKQGEELDKVRKTIIINGALNSKIPESLHMRSLQWRALRFRRIRRSSSEKLSLLISLKNLLMKNYLLYLLCIEQKRLTKRSKRLLSLWQTAVMDILRLSMLIRQRQRRSASTMRR